MCFISQSQCQQLVHQMAGSLLALGNALQLLAPHLWVTLTQTVIGQGTNACQRRAQLMRHIARKLALGLNALRNAAQQRIDGLTQPLHITRRATDRHRGQVTRVAPSQRMLKLSGEAATVMPWLTPLWNRMVKQPDSCTPVIRERVAQTLARALVLLPADAEWLASIERARQTYPRWVELQYLAGMVCWHHALWGKAQQMLELAAPQLKNADMQRQAWRTLAQLAEQKEETARAQLCWKRAAEV